MNLYFPVQCSFRTSLLGPSFDDETEVKTIINFPSGNGEGGRETSDFSVKNV